MQKSRNQKYNTIIRFAVAGIAIIATLVYNYYFRPKNNAPQTVILDHCIDGDTAKFKFLNNKLYTVRFLAIDAPEIAKEGKPSDPYGDEASEFTCKKLKTATKIHLEFEKEKEDKHGRTLAWIFVDEKLLNSEIVAQGLAKVAYLYDKYKYTNEVKLAEKKAKNSKLNLWKNP